MTQREGQINFESHGGTLVALDDGHIPETCDDNIPTNIVQYSSHASPFVQVWDNILPSTLAHAIYAATTTASNQDTNDLPWGTYVTMNEANNNNLSNDDVIEQECINTLPEQIRKGDCKQLEQYRHSLAVKAVAHVLLSQNRPKLTVLEEAHGVAVWALSSTVGSQVCYHVDYAELLRYEYNVMVPPLVAGIIQCTFTTPKNKMIGGDFAVNDHGWDHYRVHGYKGTLSNGSGDTQGGYSPNLKDDEGWKTIPYRFNRGILFSGNLPHLSTPILVLPANDDNTTKKRVILGINVFGHDVGSMVQSSPEHSSSFRTKVRLYRAFFRNRQQKRPTNDGISFESIRQNKGLLKLLLTAKREETKKKFQNDQWTLTQSILSLFQQQQQQQQQQPQSEDVIITLQYLMDKLGQEDRWPRSVDVQVHVHHLIGNLLEDGKRSIVIVCEKNIPQKGGTKKGEITSPLSNLKLLKRS